MDSTKSRGDAAAPVPSAAAAGARNATEQRAAEGGATARILRLRRPLPALAPESPDDDPGPQAA